MSTAPPAPLLPVLTAGDGWVVVAKPSGLAVHRGDDTRDTTFLVQQARDQLGQRVWPVHRLDRGTSGAVWLTFDPGLLAGCQEALAAGTKRYVALVRGAALSRDLVEITTPMKDTKGVVREAHTSARVIGISRDPRCSLVLATPRTGRFHQIRRHLRDLSHPVLGDGVHGDSRVNRTWREERGLGRLALHNASLAVPTYGIDVCCPLPDDLRRVWSALPLWDEAVAELPELA